MILSIILSFSERAKMAWNILFFAVCWVGWCQAMWSRTVTAVFFWSGISINVYIQLLLRRRVLYVVLIQGDVLWLPYLVVVDSSAYWKEWGFIAMAPSTCFFVFSSSFTLLTTHQHDYCSSKMMCCNRCGDILSSGKCRKCGGRAVGKSKRSITFACILTMTLSIHYCKQWYGICKSH